MHVSALLNPETTVIFVVQEIHSSSIFYVDPVQCDCKSKWSCIKFAGLSWCVVVVITQLTTILGTCKFCLLEAMFDMIFMLSFFPGIPLSSFTRQLTLRGDGEKTPFSYSCGSIVHSQCHQAATAELLNSLKNKAGAEDAPNTGKSTHPDQRAVWLRLNTLGSGVAQYRSCQPSQTRMAC